MKQTKYAPCLKVRTLTLAIASLINIAPIDAAPFTHKVNENLTLSSVFTPKNPDLLGASFVTYTFSGANADSINFIQLCNATDNTCAVCSSPQVIIAGTPLPYSTSGTSYTMNLNAVNAYLTAGGFAAGTYYIGLSVKSEGLACNTSNSYCATNQDNAAHRLCVQAIYNPATPGSTDLTRLDNGNAPLTTSRNLYAYVSDIATNNVWQCPVDSSGDFGTGCTSTTFTGLLPGRMTFGIAPDGTTKFYVAIFNNDNVYVCNTNPTTGALSACAGFPTVAGNPSGVATRSAAGTPYLYVADGTTTNNLYQCTLAANGNINTCSTTGNVPTTPNGVVDVVFGLTSSYSSFAYTFANLNNIVAKCPFDSNTGTLGNCTATPVSSAPAWSPTGMAITPVNTGGGTDWMSYVVGAPNVFRCNYNINTGELTPGTCAQTPSSPPWSTSIQNIATPIINGVTYAYVTDTPNHLIYKCTVDATGDLTGCAALASNPWGDPLGVTFAYF